MGGWRDGIEKFWSGRGGTWRLRFDGVCIGDDVRLGEFFVEGGRDDGAGGRGLLLLYEKFLREKFAEERLLERIGARRAKSGQRRRNPATDRGRKRPDRLPQPALRRG